MRSASWWTQNARALETRFVSFACPIEALHLIKALVWILHTYYKRIKQFIDMIFYMQFVRPSHGPRRSNFWLCERLKEGRTETLFGALFELFDRTTVRDQGHEYVSRPFRASTSVFLFISWLPKKSICIVITLISDNELNRVYFLNRFFPNIFSRQFGPHSAYVERSSLLVSLQSIPLARHAVYGERHRCGIFV